MRTFVGLALPEEQQRATLRLQAAFAGVRGLALVRPANCHLTLKFLGEIDALRAAECAVALRGIRARPFELALTSLGAFPSQARPRVLWVGVTEPPELARLAAAVDRATSTIALDKPFAPHVTIARVKSPTARPAAAAFAQPVPGCSFAVREFVLYESVRTGAGQSYAVLERFAFDS